MKKYLQVIGIWLLIIPLVILNGGLRENLLVKYNIIVEITGYTMNQVFAFQKYIDLFLK